jgi:hypothetical protein
MGVQLYWMIILLPKLVNFFITVIIACFGLIPVAA